MPSAGGMKSHTDSRSRFLAKCLQFAGISDRLLSYHLGFTRLQSASFKQISQLQREILLLHMTYFCCHQTTHSLMLCANPEYQSFCDQSLTLNDYQAQPIKVGHNLWYICIEKKSLSLVVKIRASRPSQRTERVIVTKCRHVFCKTCYDPILRIRPRLS